MPDPKRPGSVEAEREGEAAGSRSWNQQKGPSCVAGFAGRLDAGSESAIPACKSVSSMERFRNIGFAGSVNFHWCMAINLRLHHTSLCPAVCLISSSRSHLPSLISTSNKCLLSPVSQGEWLSVGTECGCRYVCRTVLAHQGLRGSDREADWPWGERWGWTVPGEEDLRARVVALYPELGSVISPSLGTGWRRRLASQRSSTSCYLWKGGLAPSQGSFFLSAAFTLHGTPTEVLAASFKDLAEVSESRCATHGARCWEDKGDGQSLSSVSPQPGVGRSGDRLHHGSFNSGCP